jgi:plastocyanin
MLATIDRVLRHPRIGPMLATVGVASLLAVASPERIGAGQAVAAATTGVKIDNFAFTPLTLTVNAGTTVTWKNEDDSPHRIADKNGTFKSAALDTDDTFSHTFTAPGVYAYICTIHPYMTGKIVVKSAKPAS